MSARRLALAFSLAALTALPAGFAGAQPTAGAKEPKIVRAGVAAAARGERVEFQIVARRANTVTIRWRGERFEALVDGGRCGLGPLAMTRCNHYAARRPARGRCYRFRVIARSGEDAERERARDSLSRRRETA